MNDNTLHFETVYEAVVPVVPTSSGRRQQDLRLRVDLWRAFDQDGRTRRLTCWLDDEHGEVCGGFELTVAGVEQLSTVLGEVLEIARRVG